MGDAEYNDSNRAFVQAFMARSSMTFEEAQPVLAAIVSVHEGRTVDPEGVTHNLFASYISAANSAISPFDLEIRSSLRQTPKLVQQDASNTPPERVYALVNTTSDPLTQLATIHSADEIAFVKRVLDFMFDTNNTRRNEGMVITDIQAIQLARGPLGDGNRRRATNVEAQQNQGGAAQPLSMIQAETMMKQLVEEGWLEKSRKGYYSLTPRALMELRGWLVSTYNDENLDGYSANRIKFCAACKDIITVGQRCGNRDCPGRLHDHCVQNFFRMQQTERCPVCKADWPGDKFVGEKALTSADHQAQGRRRSSNVQDRAEVTSHVPNGRETSDEASSDENAG